MTVVTQLLSHIGQAAIGVLCFYCYNGRKISLFLLLIVVNIVFDIVVLIVFINGTSAPSTEVLLLCFEGGISSLIFYMGTFILPVDVGKIILLRKNKKAFGQILGLITAFKYLMDSILIQNISVNQIQSSQIR